MASKEASTTLELEKGNTASTQDANTIRQERSHLFGGEDVPIYLTPSTASRLGSPTALAIGAFATTLTTLSISLMEWRGVTTTNVYIGNFFFVAGIGMVISAQWELVRGNTYGYTVLSAFGLFYGGFGAIITPAFGVADAYGQNTVEFNNALGFWVLLWTVLNTFFLIGSATINLVYFAIFFTVEFAFLLIAASYFAAADGHQAAAIGLKKAGGVFGFLSGLLGYYTLANLMYAALAFWPNMTTLPTHTNDVDHAANFAKQSLPETAQAWRERAKEVAQILAVDAAQRDIENRSPVKEVQLLKAAGLTRILGPKKYGGGGQDWSVAYQVIREVSKGDGSLGALLGYHLTWTTTANIVGTPEQADQTWKLLLEKDWFLGGAVNPRNSDLKITSDGDHIVFNGDKNFNTGGVISDATVLEGVLEGTEFHIFAIVPTKQEGIEFGHDWDNVGLRLTESGSVKIKNVRAPWTDALGWDPKTKLPIESVLKIPFTSLLLPTIQLVFSNFYLGIGWGALDAAKKWTTTKTRAWPYGGDNKEKATDEFYILERYGDFFASLRAAEALADRAGEQIRDLFADHSEKRDVTAERRGEVAEWVASVKVVTTQTSLRVTSGVFEVTGASSTAKGVGLDQYWRNVRTHTLHDPVAYKERELGRYYLLGEAPEPTWYT
ncbi:hypothetical protein DV735_g5528, partial [Chaetothyriales sp. CBS 134920]